MQSPPFPVTSALLGPNILLNTMFSNTLSFLSSRNISDQVSHPYKTRGKVIVLYILIFNAYILTGEWRRLHNEELNDLYSSPNIVRVIKSRKMRWAGHVAHMGEERGVYMVLVGKPEGRRPLGRPRRTWVDNIKMDLQEVGCGYMDSIGLAQDRDRWRTLVSAVMNLRVP